ncbi:saccharopine dehydrogenase family protein [Microbacterium invictum]|uniref:Saccharopine dehydrogenase NADP-binding domain-containing protein n=1 Tax=Microbacterium invictum TaxID=515415 RepID=A0ABZ0VFZ0_9MICO|nr:saccharopine dehydrogenase NADP-binding domain-containing protein [Microbacterium invictum]WQB71566.1 saccharopine dehydrogenase NADP-binding domain-containing protein [Microbacterium invictum]
MGDGERDYDVVLLGATGFVGRLTAAHLARSAGEGARIALAGRSAERLAALRRDLDVAWDTLVVDVADATALDRLAASTRVIASTVGPYARHGLPLVRACARAGTAYADLTGESTFAARSVREVHDAARDSGARIVHACGFDSIPSDIGVGLAHAASGGGPLAEAVVQVRAIKGGVSGGTIDSLRQQLLDARNDSSLRRTVANPYALTPGPSRRLPASSRPRGLRLDETSGVWQAPFVMGAFNQQIVQRTSYLGGWSYGELMRYREVVDTTTGTTGRIIAAGVSAGTAALVGGLLFPPTRALLDRVLPAPGEGPSEQARQAGRFTVESDVYPVDGAPMRTRISAPYDPGYDGTAVMLGESALCLAFDDLPDVGGVLTPMSAMGEALAERLRHHRFTVETTPLPAG